MASESHGKTLFLTGATGYIGLVVSELALRAGYRVRGLSRSPEGDEKLKAIGVVPVRGDLTSLDVLGREAASASAIATLAYIHDFAADYAEVLRVDRQAISTLARPLIGTKKPLIVTSATTFVVPDPQGNETTEDAEPLDHPLLDRLQAERNALEWVKEGVYVSVLRLPPYVYGRAGSVFHPMLMRLAVKNSLSIYVEGGLNHTSAVHADDAARLYLLMLENPRLGVIYNGASSNDFTSRDMAEAIGSVLDLPTADRSREEAGKVWGDFLVAFVTTENRASSKKARGELGWRPKEIGFLEDVSTGSYRELAHTLLGACA